MKDELKFGDVQNAPMLKKYNCLPFSKLVFPKGIQKVSVFKNVKTDGELMDYMNIVCSNDMNLYITKEGNLSGASVAIKIDCCYGYPGIVGTQDKNIIFDTIDDCFEVIPDENITEIRKALKGEDLERFEELHFRYLIRKQEAYGNLSIRYSVKAKSYKRIDE